MNRQFSNQIVPSGRWVAPGADLHTTITHGASSVGEVKTGTAPGIQLPGLVAVVHHLITL